jgi:hypothetical protein
MWRSEYAHKFPRERLYLQTMDMFLKLFLNFRTK